MCVCGAAKTKDQPYAQRLTVQKIGKDTPPEHLSPKPPPCLRNDTPPPTDAVILLQVAPSDGWKEWPGGRIAVASTRRKRSAEVDGWGDEPSGWRVCECLEVRTPLAMLIFVYNFFHWVFSLQTWLDWLDSQYTVRLSLEVVFRFFYFTWKIFCALNSGI